jgi:hypothetical protein
MLSPCEPSISVQRRPVLIPNEFRLFRWLKLATMFFDGTNGLQVKVFYFSELLLVQHRYFGATAPAV